MSTEKGTNRVIVTDETRVTLKMVVLVIMQVVAIAGGWFALKNEASTTQLQVQDLRSSFTDMRATIKENEVQRQAVQQQLVRVEDRTSQLKEDIGQLRGLMLRVADKLNVLSDDSDVPERADRRRK